jgi:hypothetical protein
MPAATAPTHVTAAVSVLSHYYYLQTIQPNAGTTVTTHFSVARKKLFLMLRFLSWIFFIAKLMECFFYA